MSKELFSGDCGFFLSNEDSLVKMCPKEFMDHDNKWTQCASSIFFCGANMSTWKFKSSDPTEIEKQVHVFRTLLRGWRLKHEHKEAVAGWMLSEMLEEIPADSNRR